MKSTLYLGLAQMVGVTACLGVCILNLFGESSDEAMYLGLLIVGSFIAFRNAWALLPRLRASELAAKPKPEGCSKSDSRSPTVVNKEPALAETYK